MNKKNIKLSNPVFKKVSTATLNSPLSIPSDLNEPVSADVVGESFFSPILFQSMKLTFRILNTTTRTDVKDDADIQIVEVMDRGISIQLPARSCARGHNLMIHIFLDLPGQETVEFSFTAKVEEIEPLAFGGGDKAILVLVQFDEIEWLALCKLFDARQGEIDNFLKAARGY